MALDPYPTPGVTPGGPEDNYLHAYMLLAAIESRYQDSLSRLGQEVSERSGADAELQAEIDAINDDPPGTFAYAEKADGVVNAFTNSTVFLYLTIVAPPTDRDVYVTWGGQIGLLTPPSSPSAALLFLYDITSGAVAKSAAIRRVNSTDVAVLTYQSFTGEFNAGPGADYRSFGLYGFAGRDAGAGGTQPTLYTANKFGGVYGEAWMQGDIR